jgi:hypothetical protein
MWNICQWRPTKITASSTPIPSSRSMTYCSTNFYELGLPESVSRASSSVLGAVTSSTPLVLGLYQFLLSLSPFNLPPLLRATEGEDRICARFLACPEQLGSHHRARTACCGRPRTLVRAATMHLDGGRHPTGRREDACPDDEWT